MIVVVGGGPAGAAAAAGLAEGGARTVVIERKAAARQSVCGEFVGAPAIRLLERLDVVPDRLGGQPIERVRLACGDAVVAAALPFAAWSLARDRLDEAVLQAAARRGALVLRGVAAASVAWDGAGVMVRRGDETLRADAVVLASGKHDLRGHGRGGGGMVGFKQYWRLAEAQRRRLEGHVEVHAFPGGYAGLQPAAGGCTNLCLVVGAGEFRGWPDLLSRLSERAPLLAERLAGGEPAWPRPLAVAGLPYGFLAETDERLYRVGDQLAVIHSFCGEGIAIALDSGFRAARAILEGRPPPSAAAYRRPVLMSRAAAALLHRPAALRLVRPAALAWLAQLTRVKI